MSAIVRLRVGFVVLGVLLLAPLLLLLREAEARFEAQRRLRHEIVAERIFDEMERELTTLYELEGRRPSSAYESQRTRVASWSPFVVGYFRYDGERLVLPAEAQLGAVRSTRVRRAVEHLQAQGAFTGLMDAPTAGEGQKQGPAEELEPAQAGAAADAAKAIEGSEKKLQKSRPAVDEQMVLQQLNRAATERSDRKRMRKPKPSKRMPRKRSVDQDDPLSGLDGL